MVGMGRCNIPYLLILVVLPTCFMLDAVKQFHAIPDNSEVLVPGGYMGY